MDCDNESCKVRKPRCEMVRHVQEECQYRMVPCPHCKNTYTFCLLEEHTSQCPKCPVSCPNHCGKTTKREEVASHLSDDCPLTVVPCSYQNIGCTFKKQRQVLDDHIESYVKQHLNIAVEKIVSLQEQMDEMKKQTAPLHRMEDLQKQVEEMKKQITLTNQRIQNQMDEMKISSANVMTKENEGCLSFIWEVKNAEERVIFSDPFYTHKNGYKLMLDLSNNVITLYVMRGEYDDTLTWPLDVEQVSFFHAHHDQRAQKGNYVRGHNSGRSRTAFQKPEDDNVPIATGTLKLAGDLRRPQSGLIRVPAFGCGQLNSKNYIPNDTLLLKVEIVLSCSDLSYHQLDSQLVSQTNYSKQLQEQLLQQQQRQQLLQQQQQQQMRRKPFGRGR